MQLVELSPKGKFVFVGDTHGDLEVSEYVIDKYLEPNVRICFLGDYVDRGAESKKNIDFLLREKKKHPRKIYLLQGNHERYEIYNFFPADFWLDLTYQKRNEYENIFKKFPLVISVGGIIATHGALPNIKKLKEINKIKDLDERWHSIIWADFLKEEEYHPRQTFSQDYFEKIMKNIGKKLLIRAHDPYAPNSMYDGRCVTLFTSSAYNRNRTIAIVDFTKKKRIHSVDDLVIEKI